LLRQQRRAEECFIVDLFWFLKLESSMAMRFFASCRYGFPLFMIFFLSALVWFVIPFPFFSLLVWFFFLCWFGLLGAEKEDSPLICAAYNSQLILREFSCHPVDLNSPSSRWGREGRGDVCRKEK
jgi:hypothetical protein